MKNKNALLIFVFALLLYGLFSDIIPLVDPDEPVYGETAQRNASHEAGHFPSIVRGVLGMISRRFFTGLIVAVSFSVFGVSTCRHEFPSAIIGACTASYLYLFTRKLIGEKPALTGAFICATSLEIIVLARSAVTDTALVFALTVALISFLRKEYIPAYMACGFAFLERKGSPSDFGFPALIVALWMMITKSWLH
ncbi:MAG: ArnT family glycosyltransferase [Dialister invisus]